MGFRPGLSRRGLVSLCALSLVPPALRRDVAFANEAECVTLTAYPVPEGSHPHDVALAADGARVWFTAQRRGQLGLLTPVNGETQFFDLGKDAAPHGVIVGPDGAPWITDSGRDEIQRIDPDTGELTRFSTGIKKANLNTAVFDQNGHLWFTGQKGVVAKLDPGAGEIVRADAPRGKGPYGICVTPTGGVWYVSLAGSYLGRIDVVDGRILVSEFDPPTPKAGTRRVWSDSAGNLWISEWNAGQVARFSPIDETWREWKLPGENPKAYAVYVDDLDIVWLTDFAANAIVRFDPVREEFSRFDLDRPEAEIRQLSGRPGEVWGAESGTDHLVVARTICAGP